MGLRLNDSVLNLLWVLQRSTVGVYQSMGSSRTAGVDLRGPYTVVVDEVDHTRESKDLIDSFCLL